MKRRNTIFRCGAVALLLCVLPALPAGATEIIPLDFTIVHIGQGPTKDITITVNYDDSSDKQSTDANGSFSAKLYATFDSFGNAYVGGLGFVPKAKAPGDITFDDMSFSLYGLQLSTTGLRGDLTTDTPPRPVNPDNTFPTDWHSLILNGGTLDASGTPLDLSASPLEIPLDGGFTGSLFVSAPSIVGDQATYDVTLLLPMTFTNAEVPGLPGAAVSAQGGFRATGSFVRIVPEPGTLALLAAGLAAVLCYTWRKR